MKQLRVQIGMFFIIVGFVGVLVTWNNYTETKVESYEYIVQDSTIDEIIVNNRISSVEVLPTKDVGIRIVWEVDGHKRKSDQVTVEEVENRVEVLAEHDRFLIGIPTFRFRQVKMTIYIPERKLARIDITNDLGSVDVTNINVDELFIQTDVQRINIREVEAERIHVTSSVGAITIEDSTGAITARGNVGRVLVDIDAVEGDMDLRTDVGSVELILANIPNNVSFIGASEVGSVRIFGSRGAVVVENPDYEVHLQTEVGSVHVKSR